MLLLKSSVSLHIFFLIVVLVVESVRLQVGISLTVVNGSFISAFIHAGFCFIALGALLVK